MGGGQYYGEDCGTDIDSPGAQRTADVEPAEPSELVSVFTEANPHYLLTVRDNKAVLVPKNPGDTCQVWRKIDVGAGNGLFFDRVAQPGFILVNEATGLPLRHGFLADDVVTMHEKIYPAKYRDGSIIWTLGKKDEGNGYRAVRTLTDISLNLDAEQADKAHGGVKDGHRLIMSLWNPKKNHLRWKLEPVHSEEELPQLTMHE